MKVAPLGGQMRSAGGVRPFAVAPFYSTVALASKSPAPERDHEITKERKDEKAKKERSAFFFGLFRVFVLSWFRDLFGSFELQSAQERDQGLLLFPRKLQLQDQVEEL